MGKSLMVNGSAGVVVPVNTVRFFALANAAPSAETTRENADIKQRTTGTYSKLYVRVEANANEGDSTFTFWKNGSAGNQVITVGDSAIGVFYVGAATDSVIAGTDSVCIRVATSGFGAALTFNIIAVLFEPDDSAETVVRHAATGFTDLSDGVTYFFAPSDYMGAGAQGTETLAQFKIAAPGTIRNLYARAKTNLCVTGDTVITVRKNGGNAGTPADLSVAITPLSTNPFEDTANLISVVAGDLINVSSVSPNLLNVTLAIVSFEFMSAARQFHTVYARTKDGIGPQDFNITRFIPIGGGGLQETAETNVKTEMQIAGTISKFGFLVASNTIA